MTMMPSTIPAVSIPIPIGGPTNKPPISGNGPSLSLSQGSTCAAMNGANTNRPHMP